MKQTQAQRILDVLKSTNGAWVNGQHFLRTMMISQYHARIKDLEDNPQKYDYDGMVEHSTFTDEYGFKSYRLVVPRVNNKLF